MPAGSDPTRFFLEHPDVRAELLALIRQFLGSELDLPTFWRQYNFLYADVPSGAIPDADMEFFSEVNDRLHYADFHSPPDPQLEDPREFTSWLLGALRAFESGSWSARA